MVLPPFIFIDSAPEFPGAGLIMQTKPPYYMGKVLKCRSREEYERFVNETDYSFGRVEGYRICILFAGTPNNNAPAVIDTDQFKPLLDEMAAWYLDNKIRKKPYGFMRFLKNFLS